jgi:rare lipoprotein A
VALRTALCLAAVLLVAACGMTGPKKPSEGGGKYYADDGPPLVVPGNLESIPDAVPRDEPYNKYANRPYTVFGQGYAPVVNKDPLRERGIASWYGRKFHGQKTSSGEPYDMFAMTAAHRTLPIPSYARVTNVRTGQSVVVRINDRGPFHSNRIIDLSYAAAARIGIVSAGSGLVDVERVFEKPAAAAAPVPAPVRPIPTTVETPMIAQEGGGIWIQIGAFSNAQSAETFRDHATRELPWMLEPIEVSQRDGLHRVRLGPYRNRDEASAIADKVRQSLGFAPALTR